MTQVVSRLFSNEIQAMSAVEALRKDGYANVFVFPGVLRHSSAGATGGGNAPSPLVKAMMDIYTFRYHAEVYAERIAGGAHVVAVQAIFGTARRAEEIMAECKALPDDVTTMPTPDRFVYDPRTPLSSSLLLPVLAKTKYPFEDFFRLRSVTTRPRFFSLFPMLSRSGPFLGLPTQTSSPTPFSSMLGLPVLKRR